MKRIFKFLMLIAVVLAIFTGCNPETSQKDNLPTNTIKALTQEQVIPMAKSLVRKEPLIEYSVGAADDSVKKSFETEMGKTILEVMFQKPQNTSNARNVRNAETQPKYNSTLNTENPDYIVYKFELPSIITLEFTQNNKTGKWKQHNINDGGETFDDIYYNGTIGKENEDKFKDILKCIPEDTTLFQSWYTYKKEGENKVWDTSMLSIIMTAEQAEKCLNNVNDNVMDTTKLEKKTSEPGPNMPILGEKLWETEYTKLADGRYIKMRFMNMPKDAVCGRENDYTTLLIGISKNSDSYI